MLKRTFTLLVAMTMLLATTAWRRAVRRLPPAGRVVIVRMVELSATEYRYQPTTVTASRGDTVRFLQTSAMPHNVEFTKTPPGAQLGPAKMGPFLITAGQTYDVVIDTRFPNGKYRIQCTPHFALGMIGVIVVAPRQ